jgi:hypothetical protein
MERENCAVCGGDGRINAKGRQLTSCPACRGSGRRPDSEGFHDVTKTKPSHHHPASGGKAAKKTWPETPEGVRLAEEVKATSLADDVKLRLTQSIIDYENKKGGMTKTFSRLLRKQVRELTG